MSVRCDALAGRLMVPTNVNLWGAGPSWTTKGTVFLCTTATAGITFDTDTGGQGGLSRQLLHQRQQHNDDFPLLIMQSAMRTFMAITVMYGIGGGIKLREPNSPSTSVEVMQAVPMPRRYSSIVGPGATPSIAASSIRTQPGT